jgi:hypothetical protein
VKVFRKFARRPSFQLSTPLLILAQKHTFTLNAFFKTFKTPKTSASQTNSVTVFRELRASASIPASKTPLILAQKHTFTLNAFFKTFQNVQDLCKPN